MHLISATVVLVAAMATLSVAAPASETRDPALPIDLADVHLTDDQATAVQTGSSLNGEAAVRDKRTIGPLRQLFPGLSQIVDRKIQQITRVVFRLVGRLVLGGGNSNSNSTSSGSSGGRRVSITLPTYPPTEDDDEEEDTEVPVTTDESATTPSDAGNLISDSSASASASLTSDSRSSASSSSSASSTPSDAENQLNGAESKVNEVRVPFKPAAVPAEDAEEGEEEQEDLKPAASSDNVADGAEQEEVEDNETAANDEDEDSRNKRFLPFNVGASAGGSTGAGAGASAGSGGGSGNFLFDIIRLVQKTADSAARVTGKVYRLVAGTDNVGLGFRMPTSYSQVAEDFEDTNSSASTIDYPTRVLVAGSGTTQERDEAETAPADGSTSSASASASAGEAKDDGYSEGVPGPITRLFVIANRGIANLVQDLILRLAQTSERIVNFKARLITSII